MGLVIDTSALAALERAAGSWGEALASFGNEPAALPAIVYAVVTSLMSPPPVSGPE